MRNTLALGFLLAWPLMAAAQTAETRYFTSIDGLMDGNADVILKETRSGRAVTAAVLDVCYPETPGSHRNERFVVNLTANGQALTGTGQTLGDKLPVTVKLTRRAVDGHYDFSGQVTVGQTTTQVESTDNADMSEAEYRQTRGTDSEIATAPQDFTEVSPEAIAVRVRLDAVARLLTTLKGEAVEVDTASLATACDELRAGEQVLTMSVDPERAAEFLARLKATPGVVASGWTSGRFDLERTIRFSDDGWRGGGRLDRARLAATIAEALKRALKAPSATTAWDETLGRLTITLKRPSPIVAGFGLTETLRTTAIVAPDKPAGAHHLLLWLDRFSSVISDEAPGTQLRLADSQNLDEEGAAALDDGSSLTALATAFKAERWDIEREAWK
jgi:hypothetical protein